MYESLQQTDADAAKHPADLPCWPLVVYGAVEDVRHSNVIGHSDNPARAQNGALEQFDFGGKAPMTHTHQIRPVININEAGSVII